MKFLINRSIGYLKQDRVLITTKIEDYFKRGQKDTEVKYSCSCLVKVTNDFNETDKFIIVSGTDSVQYRPKSIYKNTKGYYYKLNSKNIYLKISEEEFIKTFIDSAKEHINQN